MVIWTQLINVQTGFPIVLALPAEHSLFFQTEICYLKLGVQWSELRNSCSSTVVPAKASKNSHLWHKKMTKHDEIKCVWLYEALTTSKLNLHATNTHFGPLPELWIEYSWHNWSVGWRRCMFVLNLFQMHLVAISVSFDYNDEFLTHCQQKNAVKMVLQF